MSGARSVTTSRRLTMGDVDAVQVYAPNYFRWMDDGIHALLASLGHPLREILAEGMGMPVVDASCQYVAPVVLDDVLECTTHVDRVGTSSFDLAHEFRCGGRTVARGAMTHVWVTIEDDRQRPTPLPEWLRAVAPIATEPSPSPAAAAPGVRISVCTDCGRVGFPAEPTCMACGGPTARERSSAEGVLSTWTVVRTAPRGFEAPYVLGWADLSSPSVPVMGVVVDGLVRVEELRAGLPVRVSALDDRDWPARSAVRLEVLA